MHTSPHNTYRRCFAALMTLALGLSLLASTAQAAPPRQRQVVRAHMELGQHKLRAGQFQKALEHFEAVLQNLDQGKKKGAGKKLAQLRFRATLGAALAHWRLEQPKEATLRGQEALKLAREHKLKQAERQALRFLDDPAEAALQMAATVQELEKWLQSLETKP